jgi:uncharacterized membrane protein
MPNPMTSLIAASVAFVGLHFVLSHPLRAGLVKALGEQGFTGVYSLVSLATFAWLIWAFRAVGTQGVPLWNGGNTVLWIVACLLTIVALALLLGSLRGNPALPQVKLDAVAGAQARGVFAITRHPMMWSFALWALAHMLVAPEPRNLVLAGAILVLALVGAHLQDQKKAALLGAAWTDWERRTSYWPRLAGLGRVSPLLWVVAVVAWLAITWAHIPLAYVPAGLWRWAA